MVKFIFSLLYLVFGILSYFSGLRTKKKPNQLIENSYTSFYKTYDPEDLKKYADKISFAQRLLGIFYTVFAFVIYFSSNTVDIFVMTIFPSIMIYALYVYYHRKILTGKIPVIKIVLILFGLITSSSFMYFPYIEPSITVDNDKINIKGTYGEKIPLKKISKIYLADTLPQITGRTGGMATESIKKGYFRSKSLRSMKLFLHSNTKPYIYIATTEGKYLIINFRNKEKIMKTYSRLKESIENLTD